MIRVILSLLFCVLTTTAFTTAHAYPGAAVSTGSNPVRSMAGVQDFAGGFYRADVIAAPADQDLILTDIILGCVSENDDARYSVMVRLLGSDGVAYGAYALQSGRIYATTSGSTNMAGPTGIRIPAGVSISIQWTFGYKSHLDWAYSGTYTLSGYLAQP